MLKLLLLISLFFFSNSLLFSQTHTITGVVSNDKAIPLESANIIAKPLQEKATLKFAIEEKIIVVCC